MDLGYVPAQYIEFWYEYYVFNEEDVYQYSASDIGGVLTLQHVDSGKKWTTRYKCLSGNDFPLGKYKWSFVSDDPSKPYGFSNIVPGKELPISGEFTKNSGYQYVLLRSKDGLYTTLKAQLYYDLNGDNVYKESDDILINDPAEEAKISTEPFAAGGSTDAMFLDKSQRTVVKPGQVYSKYTGTKYKAEQIQNGVVVSAKDVGDGTVVNVPAPVYVHGAPTITMYYDVDRDGKFTSGVDSWVNGSIDVDGQSYTVTKGKVTIPKIKSGMYPYTLTDSAGRVFKSELVIVPVGTPQPDGTIRYSFQIGYDLDSQKSVIVTDEVTSKVINKKVTVEK